MRTALLVVMLMAAALHGTEAGPPTIREKVLAKIKEAAAALPPAPPTPAAAPDDAAAPPILMAPVLVFESPLIRDVAATLERREQNRREEKFAPAQGGTLRDLGPMQLGGWWEPGEGWTFLRRRTNTPTYRQVQQSLARMKDLQELFKIRERPQP